MASIGTVTPQSMFFAEALTVDADTLRAQTKKPGLLKATLNICYRKLQDEKTGIS